MTGLTRIVKRRSEARVREAGKMRRIIVTLYPGDEGVLGLRPEGTRREEFVTVRGAWERAVQVRVQKERADKRKAKLKKRQRKG